VRVLHRSCLLSALTLVMGLVAGTGCPPTGNPVSSNNPNANVKGGGGGGGGGTCSQIPCSDSVPCPIGLHCFEQACLDATCHVACLASDGTISVDTSDAGGLATPCNTTCSGPNCNCVIPDLPGPPLTYTPGTPNPADVCQLCDPTQSTTTWSNAPDGTSCVLNPPNPCLTHQACLAGVCVGSGNAGNGTPCVNPDPLCGGSNCNNGSCVADCLVLSPSTIDFGSVAQSPTTGLWCASIPKTITMTNACASAVTVNSISLAANPLFQFVPGHLPPPTPFTILPASLPITFEVTFDPNAAGLQLGNVAAINAGCPDIHTVDFTANAQSGVATNTDNFTVTLLQTPVDVLWVLDVDDCNAPWSSPAVYQGIAATVIPNFFAQAAADNINFNMALTDDDVADGEDGQFEPCANCGHTLVPFDNSLTTVFNAANLNAENELISLFPHPADGYFSPDEAMWDAFYRALCNPAIDGATCPQNLLAGHNAGFRRANAFLSIINFEDDSEDDHSFLLGNCNAQAYFDFLVSVALNPALVSYSYASDGPSPPSYCVSQLVTISDTQGGGGEQANMQTAGWENTIIALWASITAEGEKIFGLTEQPGGQINVTVSGITVCQCGAPPCGAQSPSTVPACGAAAAWTYDSVTNSIVFAATQPPGAVVSVTYPAACP
jgi:hypothetical protein